jgi:outer membrane lipoprotein-sorting protein
MKKIFAFILLTVSLISAQPKDPMKIINSVIEKFEKIRDYEVDVTIKLDFSMVKIPDMKAKYYFKQPDKVKIDSKGFAMIPKQSLNFSPAQFLKGDFTAIYVKTETEDSHIYDIIKIIPNSDSVDVILSTLWIDQNLKVIKKVETTGKRSGTLHIDLDYKEKLVLPSSAIFSFNSGNIPIREGQIQTEEKKVNRENIRRDASISGKVLMTYSNYQINKGIPDSFFEEKKAKPQK